MMTDLRLIQSEERLESSTQTTVTRTRDPVRHYSMLESRTGVVRPGIYEDKVFITGRTNSLVGAGRDEVQIFSRRGGAPLSSAGPSGRVSGITFRYVKRSAFRDEPARLFCTVTQCRATEGILSGVVIYGPRSRPTLLKRSL